MDWQKHLVSRRIFLKLTGGAVVGTVVYQFMGNETEYNMTKIVDNDKANVFFTNDISVEGLTKLYAHINEGITGKVAIKLHTGEAHGPNLLPIGLIKGHAMFLC